MSTPPWPPQFNRKWWCFVFVVRWESWEIVEINRSAILVMPTTWEIPPPHWAPFCPLSWTFFAGRRCYQITWAVKWITWIRARVITTGDTVVEDYELGRVDQDRSLKWISLLKDKLWWRRHLSFLVSRCEWWIAITSPGSFLLNHANTVKQLSDKTLFPLAHRYVDPAFMSARVWERSQWRRGGWGNTFMSLSGSSAVLLISQVWISFCPCLRLSWVPPTPPHPSPPRSFLAIWVLLCSNPPPPPEISSLLSCRISTASPLQPSSGHPPSRRTLSSPLFVVRYGPSPSPPSLDRLFFPIGATRAVVQCCLCRGRDIRYGYLTWT